MKKFLWFAAAALVLGLMLPETGSSSDETQIEHGPRYAGRHVRAVPLPA
jgi:hypothetical protein